MAVAYVDVPEGWRRLGSRGFGPFVTREVFRLPDGTRLLWDSRWHRKHAGRVPGGSTWWAPFAMAWWMGVLFAIGSICFALGSFPPYATAVGATPDNITYFIGSIFFTTASFLQYMEVASAPTDLVEPHRKRLRLAAADPAPPHRLVGGGHPVARHPVVQPDHAERAAGRAGRRRRATTRSGVPTRWAPSASSSRAGWPGSRSATGRSPGGRRGISWWITVLNLVGSIAFGVSAIASYVTSSGQLLSLALTNLGTFVGAICFLIGAVLLLPERTLEGPATEPERSLSPDRTRARTRVRTRSRPARPVGTVT